MIGEPKKFAFIDALRGLAILAVILVHAHGAVAADSAWLQELMAAGARGVQLFYIASALTLCLSWSARGAREDSPLRNFYLRRLFRIVPMFYLAIAVYLALYGLAPRYYAPNGVRWYYVPLTALFLNGFHPETITSVVPGGWSIVVEMTFYLVLPFLLRSVRSLGVLIALFLVSLLLAQIAGGAAYAIFRHSYPPEQLYLVDTLATLNFLSQFPVFVLGMIAYWFFMRPAAAAVGAWAGVALFAVWIVGWTSLRHVPFAAVLSQPIAMGAVFALLALALARRPVFALVNPLTIQIGKLSFGMYLSHFAVIDLFRAVGVSQAFGSGDVPAVLHYGAVVSVTAAISWVAHVTLERPGIGAGRRLIARLEPPAGT
ncbi:MAG: acyltransferase [Vicinamibacterales bacterium]